jgi:SSS family solute:Na+ symporter
MLQHSIQLHSIDYVLLVTYFLFVLGIGFVLRRTVSGSKDFFESGRSLPAWICALGFIGANLGAQEVMGMAASGAKYGMMTSHFYWVGAVPAMVFVAIFMMPFYYGSKARSVPEYLKLRFDEKTRGFNALTFACMTIMSSGISMYALAKLLNAILGWNFHGCILVSGIIVLAYIFMGGLTSAIYNEVLQFFLIVFGFLPLVLLGLKDVGGWDGLVAKLVKPAINAGFAPDTLTQSWSHMGSASDQSNGRGMVRPRHGARDLSFRSGTGALISWWCNGRWRPRTWARPDERPCSRRCRRCSSPRS